ncbi:MAG: hypothetical protein ACLP8X_05885 [Streptosporangiaceae bacterium]
MQQADQVAVRVLDRGDQPSAGHVLDVLVHLGAGLEQGLQGALDVADVEVADGAALVAVGIKTDVLARQETEVSRQREKVAAIEMIAEPERIGQLEVVLG